MRGMGGRKNDSNDEMKSQAPNIDRLRGSNDIIDRVERDHSTIMKVAI
jgi:hypothetical protein